MSDPPTHPDVEILDRRTAFARFLRMDVIRFRQRLFSGAWSAPQTHDVLRRGGAVAILLYDPDRESVILVEQFRLPALLAGASPWQIEVAAGLVGAGESTERVAVREMRKETGLAPVGELVPIQSYLPSPGDSDASVMLYCARVDSTGAEGVHGLAEEGEDIRSVVKPIDEIEKLLDAGAVENGHTLVALHWLLRHREALRRRWLGGPITHAVSVSDRK